MSQLLRLGVAGMLVCAVIVAGANGVVVSRTSETVTRDATDLGRAQVVIVPGSSVRADGSLGEVVRERVDAAVMLYLSGTVDTVLLSGDHSTPAYNEPDAMRDAVLAAGVPAADVFTDYAGFNTWHTMSRASEVFGVESAVVVTQGVYAARSVDLARAAGIEVQGYVVSEGGRRAREYLARVSGLVEATWRPPVTEGPAIPITGDGRDSWAGNPEARRRADG